MPIPALVSSTRLRRQSSGLQAFQQLQPFATGNPGRRVTRGERFHRRFFNNVQLLLCRSLGRIRRHGRCLLGIPHHNKPHSTPLRYLWSFDFSSISFLQPLYSRFSASPLPHPSPEVLLPSILNPLFAQQLPVSFE